MSTKPQRPFNPGCTSFFSRCASFRPGRLSVQPRFLQLHRQAHCSRRFAPSQRSRKPACCLSSKDIFVHSGNQELAEIYNRAAVSVRAAGENLEAAYLEFVGSLANALDARDQYTAGHSCRVSQLSCAVASALQFAPDDVERIRIGALLHDIGKIGIADSVLQKPGGSPTRSLRSSSSIPVIGRRILEGVQGFAPFLPAVELHHENWDGTGYPKGQVGRRDPDRRTHYPCRRCV